MFPGGVIVLAEETGVRKVQSRRFLAGVVWKTRYCVLRRDHISTLSIYKNAAAITDVPMDIITINHAAKVVNAFDGGRRILHVISENGGGMVTKELAFDTADKESRWASEIQAIIEMSRAEHSEKSAALSTSLDIKDSGSDVLIDVQPAVAIDETALSTTRSSPNFEVMKTSYAEPAIHKQLAKGTHSDSEQLGVRAPPRPGPGLSSPSGTAIALPETPKISGLSKRLEIDNISKNQLDIITMKSGTKQTEAAPVMSSKPSKPQKQPAGVSSDHTSAPVMPAADQRAKSWKTMPSSALAAPVSTMDPNAAQLHVSFDRAIMAPTLSRPSRSLAGHTIANASNELDKGLSDERLQSVYVRSGGDIISATPRRRDASKTSTAETPFSLELGLEKKIHPGNLDRNVKWSASRGGTSLNSTGSVEASSASVRRDSPDDVITSPARHNFEAENRSLMTLNKQLSQRIAAERMNGIDESAALRAQLLLLTGECSDFKIRCAALEEQNRLLESERAALSEALNSCQQSLHLEQQISVSLASQNALDKTHLVRENDIKLISVQQSENHSAVQITMEESLSARIESLTSQLKIKDDDVSRYQKLVQDLKLEIGELREQHMVAVHTSAALEQRLSSELQQEMVNESKRLAFFERENSSLKATLIERQKDIEELMKEVDRMMCANNFVNETQKNEECAGVETIAVPNNRDVSTAGFDVSASKALSEVNEALNTKLFLAQSEISSAQAQVAFLRSELARVEGVMLSEREIKGRLEAETSALHDEARRGRARIEETEEELEKKYRLQSSEIAKLNAEVTSALRQSEVQREITRKVEDELVKLQILFADETRAGHQLQVELQRKLDEAETRVSELRRDLSHVEADKESELKRLRQKNADLEDAVAELSSTLTAQRNKQMSSETKAEIISATLREKSQQLCSLEEHVTSIEAKHARDLSRCKDQCSEADSRVEAFISELSGLRRRCDELELYKRNCDSRHKLDMQDVMNKLDSAVRDASNAQISKQNLEAEFLMARNSSDQVLATLRASLDASEARCAGTEFQLSENKRKLQTALNVIKATEADAIQAVATEDAMSRLREEMEVLVRRVQEVEKEKDAVNATNQALVDELMEQLLVSTRRCDEMDEDVKTLQICAAEACQRTQEANLLSAQLSSANAALAELRRRCDDNNAELSNLRQFQAMWDSRKQSLEVELYTHVEASEQTQIKIEALQQELGHKAEDLIVMSSEYKRMCSELSQREADIRAINVDVAALEKKYGEATADLSVAESALGICEAQVEALRAQLLESDQQRQYYESISCDLREENSKMLLMLSNLEAELNSASVYRLEALEREARWQRDEALLLKEKESLQLETSRIIDAMRQQLADNASRLVSVVDRTEAERTISNLQESHIREIDRLMRDLDEQGDRNRRLIEEVVACTDIISMCSKSVTNITSHRDLDQVIRKRINDTIIARSKDDLEQSALAQLHENLSELQRTINVLSDVAEPISRAIADACLYMLRGRRWGRLDGFNNVEIEDSASCRNGSNFVDDQDANESRSLTGNTFRADEILNMPIGMSSALSVAWPIFAGKFQNEEKCSGGSSLSLSSLGLSMLAQSVVEALEWRMQLDACLQDDRAKAKYMQDERQSRIQSKLKFKISQLSEEYSAEITELKRKLDAKSAQYLSAQQEVVDLAMAKKRLKDKDSEFCAELKAVQDELADCKKELARTVADLQKKELQLAREQKMKLEFELLLRRSDTVRPGASGDLTFEMNGGHGNVSPLNSDCNSPDGLVPGIQLEEFQKLINFRDSQKNISSTNCRSSLFNGLNTDEHLDSSQHAIDIKRTQFEDYDISKSRKTTLRERLKLLH